MRYGLETEQHHLTFEDLLARAHLAEELVLDGVWVCDHFQPLIGDPKGPNLEAWTLLAALARETSTVRLGTMVSGMTHRWPAVLAAQVLTVDHLSGGRVECAVGAAWNEPEHHAYGIDFPSVRDRMDGLEEGVQILRALFTQDDVTFEGRRYALHEATLHPRPVQRPHPPIWVGGTGRTRTLPIAGRYADVWHGWADDAAEYREIRGIIDRAAREADRDPTSILRASSLSIAEPWDEVRAAHEWMAAEGIGYLMIEWPVQGEDRVRAFVQDVLPELG